MQHPFYIIAQIEVVSPSLFYLGFFLALGGGRVLIPGLKKPPLPIRTHDLKFSRLLSNESINGHALVCSATTRDGISFWSGF